LYIPGSTLLDASLVTRQKGRRGREHPLEGIPGAGWQTVPPLEPKARRTDLVAAQFVGHPEPLPGLKARIYKMGKYHAKNRCRN